MLAGAHSTGRTLFDAVCAGGGAACGERGDYQGFSGCYDAIGGRAMNHLGVRAEVLRRIRAQDWVPGVTMLFAGDGEPGLAGFGGARRVGTQAPRRHAGGAVTGAPRGGGYSGDPAGCRG
jgi:hypothetical protein